MKEDEALLDALEDPSALRAHVEKLPPSDVLRELLSGYEHELEGRRGEARQCYGRVAEAGASTAANPVVSALADLRLVDLTSRIAIASGAELQALERRCDLVEGLARRLSSEPLWLETMRVRGVLHLRAAKRLRSDEVLHLSRARAALDAAARAARALAEETTGKERILAFERYGQVQMSRLLSLFRLSEHAAYRSDAARAWSLFRTLRAAADLRTGEDRGPIYSTPRCARIELLLVPDDWMRVAVTTGRGQRLGRFSVSVRHISRLQKRFQDDLWAARPTGESGRVEEQIVAACAAVERSILEWSHLLLETPITWDDGSAGTLAAILAEAAPARVFVVPHGPTSVVPWGLLREHGASARWIDRFELVIAPSTKWASRRSRERARSGRSGVWLGDVSMTNRVIHPTELSLTCDGYPVNRATFAHAMLAALTDAKVAAVLGHGVFKHGDPSTSIVEWRSPGSSEDPIVTLTDLLDATLERGETRLCPVLLGICEAAEIHRHRTVTDFVHPAYALLLAGSPQVLAPKWSITTLSDRMLADLYVLLNVGIDDLSQVARRRIAKGAKEWESARSSGSIEQVVQEPCLKDGLIPVSDLAAMDVHGGVDSCAQSPGS
jgi:CHAT domain